MLSVYQMRRDAVAARITSDPANFNMHVWAKETPCGTQACIAGHAALLAAENGELSYDVAYPEEVVLTSGGWRWITQWALGWLGLPRGSELFSFAAGHQAPEEAALALKSAPYREE